MSFQPWKQVLPNQFYRNKNDGSEMPPTTTTASFGKIKNGDGEVSGGQSTSNLAILPHQYEEYPSPSQYEAEQHPKHSPQQPPHHNGTKFSIFSQLLNLNKINAFDNLLLNASLTLDDDDLNGDKRQGMRKLMEQAISDDAKQQIAFILEKISALRPAEKLLLYLKMPGGHCEVDPLKQSQNPLGSRSEISHTINWVRSHLEQDDKVSIPKQEVYEDYVAFCSKISIKPLSTADFGKVMKQVFPDIRPRRLGTRGHSRYCYAAMRKATKLNAPQLPDLSTSSSSTTRHSNGSDKEDASWKVIKSWSENLLGSRFESADDLASHISHMSSPSTSSASTSKQMLQKKLMQREMKEKKKVNNQPAVKRRRKKRRTSTTSSPDHNQEFFNPGILIKQEKETDGSAVENTEQSENSSDVPINLSNVRSSEQPLTSTTIIPSSQQHDAEMIKSILKSKLTSAATPQISPLVAPVAIEQKQEEHQYIYCKKVRQAQQMKANANLNATVVSNQYQTAPTISVSEPSPNEQPARVLKSPIKHKLKKDSIQAKKLKIADEDPAQLSQVEPNDLVVKKDDLQPLKEDFILPRERFISICNMDRNALDTYLNSSPTEENSQDLELLQYFEDEKNKPPEETIEEDLGTATTSVPLLENYQLNFNESNAKQEKINQLRTILEDKPNESVIKNLLLKEPPQLTPIDPSNMYPMQQMTQNYPNISDKVVPQSPNTLRKNFSFVPIPSASAQPSRAVRNVNLMPAFNQSRPVDPFASPRVTANSNRRPVQQPLNIRSPNSMSLEGTKSINNSNIPMLGVNDNTAFCRPTQFKMEPISAPPSPSMAQHFNFSPQAQQHPHQQNHFQFNSLNNAQPQGTNNYNYPVESRSQSVPPHHTNNMYNNYNNYSQSACNSVAHTPVPSDYQEFTSDTNLLDIFNNEQPPLTSVVKMETNDDVINDLLDNELLNQNSNTSDSTSDMRQNNFNSRSVPTSPYQHGNCYNNGMSSSFYPIGKSVPNTPITSTTNPFRYSPELQRTRDFLINGFNNHQQPCNNINHNNNNVISSNKMMKNHDTSQTIHHHANDVVGDVLDSSLLGSL